MNIVPTSGQKNTLIFTEYNSTFSAGFDTPKFNVLGSTHRMDQDIL